MRAIAVFVAALLAGCATSTPDAPATDGDEFQIRATVLAVYNVISGPAGRRDWRRFEALFTPGGRIVLAGGMTVLTPKEYGERSTPRFNEKGWFEHPVATQVQRNGDIAQVWSAFEGRESSNQEQPSVRGVMSVQLVRVGNEWKVQSILRERE